METFKRLQAQGKTIVLITHDPGVAAQADRQVTIRDGRLTETARRSSLAHIPTIEGGAV